MEFNKDDFNVLCVTYPTWLRGITLLGAPRPPKSFFHSLLKQWSKTTDRDYQLSPLLSAFNSAMEYYTEEELTPFWHHYICPIMSDRKKWVRGRQIEVYKTVKEICRELNISRDTFYDRKEKMARELWKRSHAIMHKRELAFAEKFVDELVD